MTPSNNTSKTDNTKIPPTSTTSTTSSPSPKKKVNPTIRCTDVDAFKNLTQQIVNANPDHSRIVLKFTPSKKQMIARTTNDKRHVTLLIDDQNSFRSFEKYTNDLVHLFAGKSSTNSSTTSSSSKKKKKKKKKR